MRINESASIWLLGVLTLLFSGIVQAGLPIQHWQSANGARVYFVESHGLPLLDISVEFDAGTRRDTADRSGLANLTSHMLNLGAGGLSEEDISRRLADVGAQLGATIDPDRVGMALRTLSSLRERTQALDLMATILQQPDFPATALEREKARIIAALQEEDTQPGPIGQKSFQAALYGTHPYALPGAGRTATVSLLQQQDVRDFFRQHYVSESAVIAIVGDVSRAEATSIADQLSTGLPRANGALPPLPEVTPLPQAEIIRLPHPASQSHIFLGLPGMSRNDADYFPLFVGNYILGGGGFASRLTEEVREKRGMAYSVYSYFMPLAQPGPFQIALQTKRDQASDALEITLATLRRFVADGPTANELRHAKQNLVGSFPLRLDSNQKILGYLSLIGYYNLPLDYLDQFVKNVDKVTLAEVKSAFKRRVNTEKMVTVIVGGTPSPSSLPKEDKDSGSLREVPFAGKK